MAGVSDEAWQAEVETLLASSRATCGHTVPTAPPSRTVYFRTEKAGGATEIWTLCWPCAQAERKAGQTQIWEYIKGVDQRPWRRQELP